MSGVARSLSARTTLVLLAGMLASNLIGLLIFTGERTTALTNAAGATNAARIAAIIRTIKTLPKAERNSALCSENGLGLTLALTDQPVAQQSDGSARAKTLRAALENIPGLAGVEPLYIAEYNSTGDAFSTASAKCRPQEDQFMATMMGRGEMAMAPGMAENMRRWRHGASLVLSYRLDDGRWLNILTPAPQFLPFWKSRFLLAFVVMTLIVSALSVWATRRSTAPLALFAWAAERLGRDVNAPDLSEDGPREVQKVARAFNEMQRRLRHLIRSRTQMLAAISHDLRTPITRLRLRAEFVENDDQRSKMLADLAQMEAMISATLAFARLDSGNEKPKALNLAGLVEVACDDAAELGHNVTYADSDRAEIDGRPVALRRAFDNLIDNAVKYGGGARVALETTNDAHVITIDDSGPGIPETEIEHVFDPFHRVETSRNPDTGGVGLGLAIVRSIIEGHGGSVTLKNRPGGGLRATVTLPRGKKIG